MNDFNRMVPPFKSLLPIADSSNLQRCELANPQPVGRGKVAELEGIEHRISDQFSRTNEELAESEERFRDLFDEAPIAYLSSGHR